MKAFTLFGVGIAAIGLAARESIAQHADVSPRVEAGKIVIDGRIDSPAETIPNVRVFGYDFGEDADDPFVIGDPGFNALGGSGLPPGSRVGFQILADLQYWSGGGGAVAVGGVPGNETLTIQYGAQTRTAGTGTGTLSNLLFGPTVGAGGTFHEHLVSLLNGSDGNAEPAAQTPGWPSSGYAGDGIEAAPGIYMLQLRVISNDPGILASDPIWIVYNNGLGEQAHEDAIDWVQGNLVPEPSAALTAGAGLAWLLARRARMRMRTLKV